MSNFASRSSRSSRSSLWSVLIAAASIAATGIASQELAAQGPVPRGTGAFNSAFKTTATGRCDANAYLLAYLCTMIYPEHLDAVAPANLSDKKLNGNAKFFTAQYEKYTRHLFMDAGPVPPAQAEAPRYEFVTHTAPSGYDPEAMVIGTATTVYVVFRGTDRVASAKDDFGYQWAEWLKTDFQMNGIPPGDGLRGRVHAGFWNSLAHVKRQIADQVIAFGGKQKRVWITGHSLGAAHAQLLGAYLIGKHGIQVQGVYAFAAPHVGDEQFVSELNGMFPDSRLQRFDFVDDPITMLPPYVTGYQRAGTRNYYDDLDSYSFKAPERRLSEGLGLLGAVLGAGVNALKGAIGKQLAVELRLNGSAFCYHHPTWYLSAAYHQLSKTEKLKVPTPLGIPKQGAEACSMFDLARGRSNKPEDQAKEVVDTTVKVIKEKVEEIVFEAKSLLDNATGSAIAEGSYTIRCYRGGKFLQSHGDVKNGTKVDLWEMGKSDNNNTFTIKRDGVIGYTIKRGGRFLEIAAEDLFDNNGKLQLWEANGLFGGHLPSQQWLFRKIQGNKYLIQNLASLKVIDADDSGTSKNGGRVKQWSAIDNDATQVWILERADGS